MAYLSECKECNKSFESEKPAKYCSSSCRVTAHRNVTAKSKTVTADVTDKTTTEYGSNDFTRKMVDDNVAKGDLYIPNWYRLGFDSKNHFKKVFKWDNA